MTSTREIRPIDLSDETALRAWWEVTHAAGADRPHDFMVPWELARVSMPAENTEFEVVALSAYDGDRVVGTALVHLPRLDNLHLAYSDVTVPPAHRRRGTGSALLAAVEDLARRAGRTHLLVDAATPPGAESDGSRFGRARGYAEANLEEQKVLDLVASERGFGALEAGLRLDGYRVVEWGDEVPEEHVQGFCDLLSTFVSEIPTGDLALEDGEWTPARVRANEARSRAIGRRTFVAAAIAPDGTVAGVSDLRLTLAAPRIAHIGITVVSAAHRGHGLGLAMKLATHRSLRAAVPECELVATSNAGVNVHMNAVNERLGYRVVESLRELQKVL